jgi:hypothetical protein
MTEVALTQLAQLDLGRNVLRLDDLTEKDGIELANSLEGMLKHITVLDKFDWADPLEVIKKLEYAARIHGARVLVLDHVTWLAESSREDSRIVLERVMPALKSLATTFGVTIHVISHLSRDKADKDDTQPSLNRLKNSSAIVQVSDAVIGIKGNRQENKLEIVALKQNRLWGRTERESTVLTYNPDTTRLEQSDEEGFASDFDDVYEGFSNEDAEQVRDGGDDKQRAPITEDVREAHDSLATANKIHARPSSSKRADSGAEGATPPSDARPGEAANPEPTVIRGVRTETTQLLTMPNGEKVWAEPYEGGGFIPPKLPGDGPADSGRLQAATGKA